MVHRASRGIAGPARRPEELRAIPWLSPTRQPVALAGIMAGGEASAVGEGTRNILLESAFFAPDLLAGKARSYGLHTESLHRF